MAQEECPYCNLKWEELEEFKVVNDVFVIKEHGYYPERNERALYYDMLEKNGFKISVSFEKHSHFIVRLR